MENQPTEQNNNPTVIQPTPEQPIGQPAAPQSIVQQPIQQPIQYAVHPKPFDGIGGWLICYIVVLVLASLGFITAFFAAIADLTSSTSLVTAIFAPFIAGGAIASVILIAMQKKLGKIISVATIGISGLYFATNLIVSWLDNQPNMPVAILIGTVLSIIVGHGFLTLYFFVSKRVNQTLIKE